MTELKRAATVSDVVLVKGQVGVVRYVGPLQNEKGLCFGIEMKAKPLQGHNGTLDNVKYFTAKDGHGQFTKSIDRIIPPEELLDKVASLYDLLKHNKNVDGALNNESMDKTKYEELLHEHEILVKKCKTLEEEKKSIMEECTNKLESFSKLNEQLTSLVNRFGLKDIAALCSLDEHTIHEINRLLNRNKEQDKLLYHSENHSNTNNNNNNNIHFSMITKADDLKHDNANPVGENRKKESNIVEDTKFGKRLFRGSRPSVQMSHDVMAHQVIGEMNTNANANANANPNANGKARKHRPTPSDIAIASMDKEWQNKLKINVDTGEDGQRLYVKPKRKHSFSLTPSMLELIGDDNGTEGEEDEEEKQVNSKQRAKSAPPNGMNEQVKSTLTRRTDVPRIQCEPITSSNASSSTSGDSDNSSLQASKKHNRTPSEIAIDNMDPQWEDHLVMDESTPHCDNINHSNHKSNFALKPLRKNSLSIAKNKTEETNNLFSQVALNELALEATQEIDEDVTEEN